MSLNPSGMEIGLELLHRLSKCCFVFSFLFFILSCFKSMLIIICKNENITID